MHGISFARSSMTGYCDRGAESAPPALLHCWRAHVDRIVSLEYSEDHSVIVTASPDCTMRLWSHEGIIHTNVVY